MASAHLFYRTRKENKKATTIKDFTPNDKSKHASPPPQRVVNVPPTPMEQIKAILNYKII